MLRADFSLGVRATYEEVSNSFEVFCNRCNQSIGTMLLDTVRHAMFNTFGRAGILCPGCRKQTCDGCGTYFVSKSCLAYVEDGSEKIRLCSNCAAVWFWADGDIEPKIRVLLPSERVRV